MFVCIFLEFAIVIFSGFVIIAVFLNASSLNDCSFASAVSYPCGCHSCGESPGKNILGAFLTLAEQQADWKSEHSVFNKIILKSVLVMRKKRLGPF